MQSRRQQGVLIAIAVVAGISFLAIMANVAPYDDRVFHWQWQPVRFVSCILTARETLAAGLIAAGGALFAAWLAWSAIRDQINFEAARDAAQRRRDAEERKLRAEQERFALQMAADQLGKFMSSFRGIDASSEWNYLDDLRRLSKNGELSFYPLPLPPLLGAKFSFLTRKIGEQAAKINTVDTDPTLRARDAPGQITSAVRSAYIDLDAAIKATIDQCHALIGELYRAIEERDKIWAD